MRILTPPQSHVQPLHDPLVCGLDIVLDCPACQRARRQAEHAALDRLTPAWLRSWRRLRERFPQIRRGARDLDEGEIPKPFPDGEVARLVRTLADAKAREPIAAALTPEIFAIARHAVRAELAGGGGAK